MFCLPFSIVADRLAFGTLSHLLQGLSSSVSIYFSSICSQHPERCEPSMLLSILFIQTASCSVSACLFNLQNIKIRTKEEVLYNRKGVSEKQPLPWLHANLLLPSPLCQCLWLSRPWIHHVDPTPFNSAPLRSQDSDYPCLCTHRNPFYRVRSEVWYSLAALGRDRPVRPASMHATLRESLLPGCATQDCVIDSAHSC